MFIGTSSVLCNVQKCNLQLEICALLLKLARILDHTFERLFFHDFVR